MSANPRTLVTISTDPRKSARPAEAIRIAAGAGTWKKTDITLLLRGVAGYCLSEYVDEYIDEDNFTRYLPIVAEFGRPIYLADDFTDLEALEGSPWKYQIVNAAEIAALYANHEYFIQL